MARDLLIGFGVGAFSGAFGVGGGIILVPILVLLLHMQQKHAQATSLVTVAIAAAAGAVTYALAGAVEWWTAAALIAGGLLGSWVGSSVVRRAADVRLQAAFGILMIVVAIGLFLLPVSGFVDAPSPPSITQAMLLIVAGLGAGVLSALFGIGGGLIIVPTLVMAFDFPQQWAAGTALVMMIPIAVFGAWRQHQAGYTQWKLGGRVGIGAVPGGVVGATVAVLASGNAMRIAFALVMIIIGMRMTFVAALRSRGS